jgi:uncharacterized membrane protein YwzB
MHVRMGKLHLVDLAVSNWILLKEYSCDPFIKVKVKRNDLCMIFKLLFVCNLLFTIDFFKCI